MVWNLNSLFIVGFAPAFQNGGKVISSPMKFGLGLLVRFRFWILACMVWVLMQTLLLRVCFG
jgi:hypothetical protein